MQFFTLLAPAALVALASAQYYDDEQFDILARDEAPGYDDLGFFIRDVNEDNLFDLKTREAEPEFLSEETEITLSARDAEDFDSLITLEEREAEPEAEAVAEPKKKKSKKNKKKKGKKGKKNKKGKKKNKKGKKKTKAQKKKAAAARKQAKLDADIWG